MKEKISEMEDKGTRKNDAKYILHLVILAFLVGMALRGGGKLMDRIWPDVEKPLVVEHRVVGN